MANVVNIPGGASGGKITWNVVTGLAEPPVKTNGLWAKVDADIKDVTVVFDLVRPAAPKDKTLFIRYYSSKGYPLVKPLEGQDGIRYQAVAAQYYTTAGGWQNIDAYRELGGKWVRFSQGEYYIYAMTSDQGLGNALQKYDLDGNLQWEYVAPSNRYLNGFCIDIVSRSVFAGGMNGTGLNDIYEIDIDTGTLKRSMTNYINLYSNACALELSADRSKVFISSDIASGESTFTWLDRTAGVVSSVPLAQSTKDLHALPDGTVWGVRSGGSNAKICKVYPNEATPFNSEAYSYRSLAVRHDGKFAWLYFDNAVTAQCGTLEPPASYSSTINVPYTRCGAYLPNGDLALGYNGGFRFCAVDYAGMITAYKTILTTPGIQDIYPMPDGTILARTDTAGTTYKVGLDDTVTTLAIPGLLRGVEPGQIHTFPELFPSREQESIYDNGTAAYPLSAWYTGSEGSKLEELAGWLHFHAKGPYANFAGFAQAIDLTDVSRIEFEGYWTTTGDGAAFFGATQDKDAGSATAFAAQVAASQTTNGTVHLNVANLTGPHYIGLNAFGASASGYVDLYVYRITLIYN